VWTPRLKGGLCGWSYAHLFANFLKGFFEGRTELVIPALGWGDDVLGADETGQGGGGEAEGAKERFGFGKGGGVLAEVEDVVDEMAEELDLGGEGEELGSGGRVLPGVVAVFEGVAVAEGGTAFAFGHGISFMYKNINTKKKGNQAIRD